MTREEKAEKLLTVVEAFIKEHDIGHAESIYQCDRIILAAPEFLEKVCDVVGYIKYSPEDE